jgi:hypothetical protein
VASTAAKTNVESFPILARLADPMLALQEPSSFGVADTTVRNYLDKLTDALVVR